MQRWILPLLISSSTFIFLFEDIIFGQHRSPFFPRLAVHQVAQAASTSLEEAWQSLHRARQRREQVSQALAALAEAEALAGQVEDVSQQGLLLRTIAAEYARLGAFDRAIATALQLDYETKPPGGGLESLRSEAEQTIVRAYLREGQLDEALGFAQSITDIPTQERGLERVVQALAEQGRLDEAVAIAQQVNNDPRYNASSYYNIPMQKAIAQGYGALGQYEAGLEYSQTILHLSYRANFQLTLMKVAIRQGQYDQAADIARQIRTANDRSELTYLRQTGLREVALAYGQVGQVDQAVDLLAWLYSLESLPGYASSDLSQWAWELAKVGAYDLAIAKANAIENDYAQAEARMNIARVYVDAGQYQAALDLAQQVEDGTLQPLADYEDKKVELLYHLVEQSARAQLTQLVIEAAEAYGDKDVQVKLLLRASRQYRLTAQTQAATDALWQGFEIAKTIDRIFVQPDRHTYYEISNAGLLIEIAEEAIALGQTDLAQMALEAAAQSARVFETTPLDLSRRWQAEDLNRVAQLFIDLEQPAQAAMAATGALTLLDVVEPTESIGVLAEAGEILWRVGDRDRAREVWGQAQTLAQASNDSWPQLIQAYVKTGQVEQTQVALEQALSALPADEESRQRDNAIGRLAIVTAGLASPDEMLALIDRMGTPQAQINTLAEIAINHVDANQTEQAAERLQHLLGIADTLWEDDQREGMLFSAIYTHYQFYDKTPWPLDLIMPTRDLIQDPERRAASWRELVWAYTAAGDDQAAHASMVFVLEAISQISSRFDRQEKTWEFFEQFMKASELGLAAQIANAFATPAHRVTAFRQVAHQHQKLGQTGEASDLLDQAQRAATGIEDAAHRQMLLDAN
ncbi:MAG: hypothetical protein AAF921_12330 [Cyanobacteria bacterium P01_D01_bin.44]